MGKVSVKDNKNIYQLKREEVGLTREQAAEKIFFSADTIERIENRGAIPSPEMVLKMAEVYREPALCNYYCSKQCPIGGRYVPEVSVKDFRQIVLEMMISMNNMQSKQQRLMEISLDNTVDDDQIDDFIDIQDELEKMSILVETLQFWSEEMLAEGKINREAFEAAKAKRNK